MNVADQRYFKPWLKELGKHNPEKLWRGFIATNELPGIDFSNAVSAVYSANIQGNPLDGNSYLASQITGRKSQFRDIEPKAIDNLESAYYFDQRPALDDKNIPCSH